MLAQLPSRLRARRAIRRLPDTHVVSRLTAKERAAFYEHAVRAAWADGRLRFHERLYLDRLRRDLGLSDSEGQRLEARAYAQA
jgi:hypothetical protein